MLFFITQHKPGPCNFYLLFLLLRIKKKNNCYVFYIMVLKISEIIMSIFNLLFKAKLLCVCVCVCVFLLIILYISGPPS